MLDSKENGISLERTKSAIVTSNSNNQPQVQSSPKTKVKIPNESVSKERKTQGKNEISKKPDKSSGENKPVGTSNTNKALKKVSKEKSEKKKVEIVDQSHKKSGENLKGKTSEANNSMPLTVKIAVPEPLDSEN